MAESEPPTHDDLIRPFLHLPEGDRLYVCIVDEQRRPFDFTDNTFKVGNKLANVRDACLTATGHYEPRADHQYSYRVEIHLARLLKGKNPETIPAEGALVTVHWLRQLGDEPDVLADTRLASTISLQNIGGQFQPTDKWDADCLDESREFAQREKFAAEYRKFVLREFDIQDARRARMALAVRSGSVASVLRILAEDICNWAGNLKQHLLHQISHLAKDPFFARSRQVPDGAAFQVHETWAVRDWIGSHEAFDMLEFHKSADFARSFSARLDKLHEARVEFSHNVVAYTAQTRGEDVEGVFALDEARKELKHRALFLAEYLDVIALQFEAAGEPKPPAEGQRGTNQDERSRSQVPLKTSRPPEGGVALLEEFAGALVAYTGLLNQIIIEALHPEIESFDDAIKWTTSRQAELAQAQEHINRQAGTELVAVIIAPDGTSSEQWMVQLLAMVAESRNAISYVFTLGPHRATSDDLRDQMAARVVSRQLETASNLGREIDSCHRVLVASILTKRLTLRSDSPAPTAAPNMEESSKAGPDDSQELDESPVEPPQGHPEVQVSGVHESQQFSGGEIVFYDDRVEICGVDVCSGPRSGSRRVVLELLSRQKNGKTFIAYSGEELESRAKEKGAKGNAVGWIRDLRDDIVEALRTQANIISGQRDVILSGGPGYRFAECLTVRYESLAAITDITDTAEPPDVRDDDVRNVFDVRDDEAARRREWIIQQLEAGVQLKAPLVASQFKRSKKTAQRDLDALRDEGKIEFVGDPRTGFYRLVAGK